jgi:glycolate oxidase
MKRAFMAEALDPATLDFLRRTKAALDPGGS